MLRLLYWLYESRLRRQIGGRQPPRHVGIILDGNRRYAHKHGLADPGVAYDLGAEKLDDVLAWCSDLGIPAVTFWVCSIDNLKRQETEVSAILAAVKSKIAVPQGPADRPRTRGLRSRSREAERETARRANGVPDDRGRKLVAGKRDRHPLSYPPNRRATVVVTEHAEHHAECREGGEREAPIWICWRGSRLARHLLSPLRLAARASGGPHR